MNIYQRGQLANLTHPSKFEPRDLSRPSALERLDRHLDALLRRAGQSRVLFA
ncbi:hypothetical protein [Mesorhizobium sp. M7A.F.Ca.CA.004.02.1.1]|uniref:hypothetical protein n=1 Tax=Mesorhizobium sp. M7A.F.Ca.CA.004.02.1.1 TaxID=2496690 RepID=UPI0013DF3967|nr:hypothetical protein [Mesorhizobium sp. M7A.F.Ca.CA.004.02.1.1]